MSELIDDIAYLSQEIGPRPAGTEEEHQAALYLVDRFAQSAGLRADVEDFACSSNYGLHTAVLFGLAAAATLVGLFVKSFAAVAFIITLICAALEAFEITGHPMLSRVFERGASQNVIARFEPAGPAGARRRKIVIVANYDSDRVEPMPPALASAMPLLQKAACVALVALPLLWLIRTFAGDNLVFVVLFVVAAVLVALPLVRYIVHASGAYNEAANCNATGAAALVQLAARVREAASAEPEVADDGEQPLVYGEEAAREAGMVPEGAQLEYEVEPNAELEENALEMVADDGEQFAEHPQVTAFRGNATDIADKLVQVEPQPPVEATDEAVAAMRADTRQAFSGGYEPAPAPAPAPTWEPRYAPAPEPAVPDWYTSAKSKANRTASAAAPARRSRYADALDAAVAESRQYFERANRVVEDEAAQRYEAKMQGIVEIAPPEPAQEASRPSERVFAEPAGLVAQAAEPAFDEPNQTTAIDPIDTSALRPDAEEVHRLQSQPSRELEPAERTPGDRVVVDEAGNETVVAAPELQPVRIPQVTLPDVQVDEKALPSLDSLKQRAPLADAYGDMPASGSPSLSSRIPRIESVPGEAAAVPDNKLAALRATLPSMSGTISAVMPQPENTAVSLTGSFAAVGATGAFAPVTDDLVADVPPEDRYVEDADDSAFDESVTETGAYAGPGYMDMPKSRFSLFGRRRKKAREAEQSASDWIGVDGDYDARSVGAERGGWESFQEGSDYERQQRRGATYDQAYDDYDEFEDDDWNGGSYSRERMMVSERDDAGRSAATPARMHEDDPDEAPEGRPRRRPASGSLPPEFANVAALAAAKSAESGAQQADADMRGIYEFHASAFDTEVWFVALGSENAGNGGMKAFLAEHGQDLRGSVIVNLEALGAGELSHLTTEGAVLPTSPASRVKRYLREAAQVTGRQLPGTSMAWRESAASVALKRGLQAVTLVGVDGGKPALWNQGDDVLESIDAGLLEENVDYVFNFIKNI